MKNHSAVLVGIIMIIAASLTADTIKHISRIDKIRAVVNGNIITQGDIDILLARDDAKADKMQENMMLERLIKNILLKQKAEELGIVIPQSFIDGRLEELKVNYKHIPDRYIRDWIETDEIQKIVRQVLISPKISVSPDAIKHYYTVHQSDFQEPTKVLIRVIAVQYTSKMDIEAGIEEIRSTLKEISGKIDDKPSAERIEEMNRKVLDHKMDDRIVLLEELLLHLKTFMESSDATLQRVATKLFEKYQYFKTEDKAKELCEEILHKLEQSEDFETLAIQYSEGPHKDSGGKWDWFGENVLSSKFKIIEETAFSLKNQEISSILDADSTKYIEQKIGEKPASRKELSSPEVQKFITQKLKKQLELEARQELLKELHESAYIKRFD